MTEKFKEFAREVNSNLINDVTHELDESYNIKVEKDGETLMIPVGELQKYYQLYSLGRKSFSQTITKAATIINKTIIQWYNLE